MVVRHLLPYFSYTYPSSPSDDDYPQKERHPHDRAVINYRPRRETTQQTMCLFLSGVRTRLLVLTVKRWGHRLTVRFNRPVKRVAYLLNVPSILPYTEDFVKDLEDEER